MARHNGHLRFCDDNGLEGLAFVRFEHVGRIVIYVTTSGTTHSVAASMKTR